MWLTSVPSVWTLWLMANALVLPIHSLTHTCTHTHTHRWTHQLLCTPNTFLLGFTCKCACPCVCNAKALLWTWSDITAKVNFNNSRKINTASPEIQPLSFVTDMDVSKGWKMREWHASRQSALERVRQKDRERESKGEERRAEDRQGKHFGCHCVHRPGEENWW